ncbi:uncharacterized protein Dwil_GK22773 [Drosophila willistoni]|uniref:J domain-containing protein n=2 Tax=Drosophila willistoni TaxID=7260 RepID=B4NG57_DROWI|nr:uncharacterized protein Dwil_GK22773 [Drosophila willistoni]
MPRGPGRKENLYDVLEIPKNSSKQEIKRAFVELSKKYHPDSHEKTRNSDEFMRVYEAYEELKKESLRAEDDTEIKMPAVDTSRPMVNVCKKWREYQADNRRKQQGNNFKIKASPAKINQKPWLVKKDSSASLWLPPETPSSVLVVSQIHRENVCDFPSFSNTEGDDTEMPSEWMCYFAGFGLVSGLLFMDSVSDWCDKEPSECPKPEELEEADLSSSSKRLTLCFSV